ncbi:TVP38/TMEM64 family protein [Natronorarus salvus]|uniref:TVP38/TMEM64 family protein n=1 Tax=Natronorarus salvus TaxID=3117733 RepID=UPI002F2662BF
MRPRRRLSSVLSEGFRPSVRTVIGVGLLLAIVSAALVVGPDRAVAALTVAAESPWLLPSLFALYLVRPLLGWPHSPFPLAVGFLLGVTLGTVVALAGAVLTALPPYLIGCWLGTDSGQFGRVGERGRRFAEGTGSLRAVVAARLTPLPIDLVSYGAGVARVRPRPYVLGTFLGEIPWIAAFVAVGAGANSLTAADLSTPGVLPVVLLTALGLLLLAKPLWRVVRD